VGAPEVNPNVVAVLEDVLSRTLGLDVPDALDLESRAYSELLAGPEFARWLDKRGPRALPPVVEDPVLLARDGDVLRITLNRPERRNAYGAQVRDALVAGLEVALHDPEVRVVLDGAGPCFCAGGDLAEFGTTPDLETAHVIRTRHGAALPLHRLAARTEVRVHGTCVGAGIELAAFAGRVVAAPGTTFRLPEVGMGLIPGAGGTVSLPRRIGVPRTLSLALSGVDLDVETALAWGLVDEIR
jgi:enoyl-CoA hydratase/carnithine racemase